MDLLTELWEAANKIGVVSLLLAWGYLGYKRVWVWGSSEQEWKEIAQAALDINDRLTGVATHSVASSTPSSRAAAASELRRRRRRL